MHDQPVIIIGAGLAGLACALKLSQNNIPTLILERSDRVGGRVATDIVDGYRLDRGFQVLLTAYPILSQLLDVDALDLCKFDAGAMIWNNGKLHSLYDPRRHPSHVLGTAFSSLISANDKLQLFKLWMDVKQQSPAELLSTGDDHSTQHELLQRGFSQQIIQSFFQPFFGGVFLQKQLSTSCRFFKYTFRMFADGFAAVPAMGMGEIATQLANKLPKERVSIRLNTSVASVYDQSVILQSGEKISASAVVVASDLPSATRLLGDLPSPSAGVSRSAWTVYFTTDTPTIGKSTLVLNGQGESDGPINHLAEMTSVSPAYAPPRKHLLAASTLDPNSRSETQLIQDMQQQLSHWFNKPAHTWKHLKTYHIPHALPPLDAQTLQMNERPMQLSKTLFVTGDHRTQPSIQGALSAGVGCAKNVMATL